MNPETSDIEINGRRIGSGQPVYVIAEMSANHNQDFDTAVAIVKAAKEAGADAVKLQTYTPDTITLDSHRREFRIAGTIWAGRTLHSLYQEAYMPWQWQPKLKQVADDIGIDLFASPFDHTAVDFLEAMGVPAYKIASFELTDLPLLRKIAATGKPIIMSTGMATLDEIVEAVETIRGAGGRELALLKCTSSYPASPDEMNLRTIPDMAARFSLPVGLSDHTLDSAVAVASVALGACIIEKHVTLSRSAPGPDSRFSLEPHELESLIRDVRTAERALGEVRYDPTAAELHSRAHRRSLFAVADIPAGATLTPDNVRCIRPGHGLAPKHYDDVIGRKAVVDIEKGQPLSWSLVDGPRPQADGCE